MRFNNPPTLASVVAALGYTPVNKAGDTMTGGLLFTDNAVDIGASNATRFRTAYGGTSVLIGNSGTGTDKGTIGLIGADRNPMITSYAAGVAQQFIQMGVRVGVDEMAFGSGNGKTFGFYSTTTYSGSRTFASMDLSSATQPYFAFGLDGPNTSTRTSSFGVVSAGVIGIGTGTAGSVAGTLQAALYQALPGTAVGAGANTQAFIKGSSTANLGLYYGTGDPSFTAAKGSLYVKTDATTVVTRLWVNTDGGTTWTFFTSGA